LTQRGGLTQFKKIARFQKGPRGVEESQKEEGKRTGYYSRAEEPSKKKN